MFVSLIIIVLLVAPVQAYDISGGRQAGVAGAVVFSVPAASDYLICPSPNIDKGELLLESGWYRKFELSELDKVFLTAGYRYNNVSAGFGFSQFGESGYYTESVLRTVLIYHYKNIAGGLVASGRILEIGPNNDRFRAGSIGLSAAIKYRQFNLGMMVDNINRPRIADILEGENVVFSLFGEYDGGSKHSLVGGLKLEQGYDPRVSLGQFINFNDNNALYWGLSQNPLMYGGGFEFEYSDFTFVYALSFHPVLGFSHNVSLRFSAGGAH
jgi:hypothetical protein